MRKTNLVQRNKMESVAIPLADVPQKEYAATEEGVLYGVPPVSRYDSDEVGKELPTSTDG